MVGKNLIRNFLWIFLIGALNAQNYDKIEEINYLPDSLFYNGLDSLNGVNGAIDNGNIDLIVPITGGYINPTLHFKIDTTYNYFDILSISFFYDNDSSWANLEKLMYLNFLDERPWYQDINQVWYSWTDPAPWQNLTPLLTLYDTLEVKPNSNFINMTNSLNLNWSWYEIDLTNKDELQNLTFNELWVQFESYDGLFPIFAYHGFKFLDSTFYHNFYMGGEFVLGGNNVVGWGQSHSGIILSKIKIGYHDLPNTVKEKSTKPLNFKLSQNFPNPFNPTTSINYEFQITNYEFGTLTIFNVLGEEVKSFLLTKNSGKVVWDGKNEFGKSVSSGNYFYELKVGKQTLKKKMTLLK